MRPTKRLLQRCGAAALLGLEPMTLTYRTKTLIKLGGDVSMAAGPSALVPRRKTANVSADILSFARAKGLYPGASLDEFRGTSPRK